MEGQFSREACCNRLILQRGPERPIADDVDVLTRAPANDAPIGGVKVVAESAWFAARPSGTEDCY